MTDPQNMTPEEDAYWAGRAEAQAEIDSLRADLARVTAELRAALAHAQRMRTALVACHEWRGLDGDGISDPTRTSIRTVLSLIPPASLEAHDAEVRDKERERCAVICEKMVVGGRAWTESQEHAGNALLAAASYIRRAEEGKA